MAQFLSTPVAYTKDVFESILLAVGYATILPG